RSQGDRHALGRDELTDRPVLRRRCSLHTGVPKTLGRGRGSHRHLSPETGHPPAGKDDHRMHSDRKAGRFSMTLTISSPVCGSVIALSAVPDRVFAEAIVGPGTAVDPGETATVTAIAPISGTLKVLTPHAYVVVTDARQGGLVHLGIDTVELAGPGVAVHAAAAREVRMRHPLIPRAAARPLCRPPAGAASAAAAHRSRTGRRAPSRGPGTPGSWRGSSSAPVADSGPATGAPPCPPGEPPTELGCGKEGGGGRSIR